MPIDELKLYLFGPARVERAGRGVRFDTKKALALLAYLSMEGPQTRDHLADLLWPAHEMERARGALRRTLSSIRSASGDRDLLDAERDRIRIQRDRLWVDVLEFKAALEKARSGEEDLGVLERAVALARPEVMGGLTLRGTPEFEHWQYRTGELVRKELGSALGRLVKERYEDGHSDIAIEHAQRWSELDPLHEPAHRWLMRLYAQAGDRAAAIEQYRRCVRVLTEELGVAPLDETTELYESLVAGGGAPTESPRAEPHDVVATELPLVGRAREREVLKAGANSDRRFIAIEGEPGIGKTRLAHELMRLVEYDGRNAIEVRCHEDEASHAFGVASRILHSALDLASVGTVRDLDPASAREAARLIPEVRTLRPDLDAAPPLDSPGAQTSFFHGVWETLVGLLSPRAAIVVDDAQWSDPGSIELLGYGLRRLERLPLIVVATWRRDDVAPGHALRRALIDAERNGFGDALAPQRLTQDDIAALLAELGEGSDAVRRLIEETEGVPFFVAEYLKLRGVDRDHWPVAPGVQELVRTQVARLSELGAQLLTAAAVLGRDLTPELLEAVAGRSPDETAEALDELERRGLLVAGQTSSHTYNFSHEKVRQVVYDDASLARRRLLHSRAADELEHRNEMALAAHHAQQAGREPDAARLFIAAAERARALFANDEALSHMQAALALGHPQTAELYEGIGDIQTLRGRYADAFASYQSALAYTTDREATARLERRMGSLFLRRGEGDRGLPHLQRAVEFAETAAEQSRSLAELALAEVDTGRVQAAETAGRARAAAEEAGDDAALARAHNVLGIVAARTGDTQRAREHLTTGVDYAARLADPTAHVAALNNLALTEHDAGSRARAIDLLQEAVVLCEKQGDLHRAAALHNNLADVFHAEGRASESEEHARRAAALFGQIGNDPTLEPGIWKLVSW